MIIDCHQHAFWRYHDDRRLVDEMDRYGIDKAWLLTWYLPAAEDDPAYHTKQNPVNLRPDGTHAAMPLADVVTACRNFPDRFVPGYIPCPTEGHDPAALFEAAYHMHGVRVCGEWSYRTLLDDPRAINLFRKCGQLGCPVLIHMDVPFLSDGEGGRKYQRRQAARTARELPEPPRRPVGQVRPQRDAAMRRRRRGLHHPLRRPASLRPRQRRKRLAGASQLAGPRRGRPREDLPPQRREAPRPGVAHRQARQSRCRYFRRRRSSAPRPPSASSTIVAGSGMGPPSAPTAISPVL